LSLIGLCQPLVACHAVKITIHTHIMHPCYFYPRSTHHIFVPFRSTKNVLLLHWEWTLKIFPIGLLFLLAKYLYNCSKFSSSLSYQFCSSYKRLVIHFLLKKERSKSKQKKKKKKERKKEKKDIYATKFPFIFQGSEERSYFQVWSIVELDFHLFLSISFIPHHFSHRIKPHMHLLIWLYDEFL
jgi:hypothetical protein